MILRPAQPLAQVFVPSPMASNEDSFLPNLAVRLVEVGAQNLFEGWFCHWDASGQAISETNKFSSNGLSRYTPHKEIIQHALSS